MEDFKLKFVEASVVHVKPNDVVILKFKKNLSNHAITRLTEHAKSMFPDNKIMVCTENVDLEVMTQ